MITWLSGHWWVYDNLVIRSMVGLCRHKTCKDDWGPQPRLQLLLFEENLAILGSCMLYDVMSHMSSWGVI